MVKHSKWKSFFHSTQKKGRIENAFTLKYFAVFMFWWKSKITEGEEKLRAEMFLNRIIENQ